MQLKAGRSGDRSGRRDYFPDGKSWPLSTGAHKKKTTTMKKKELGPTENCPLVSSIYWASVPVSEPVEACQTAINGK